MKINSLRSIISIGFLLASTFLSAVDLLRCEYLNSPLGIDVKAPRLSWKLSKPNINQQAYQLIVGTDSLKVRKDIGEIWDTGRILSPEQLIIYQGNPLQPYTKYYWKVKVWDDVGELKEEISAFETGLIDINNWEGNWITDTHDIRAKPAAYFRKGFTTNKKVKEARAYITIGGLYELYINGEKVGNHRLDPMFTRFDRRTLYLTHDVTSLLQNGANAVGVLLGNGWYNHQSIAVWNFDMAPWRARPKFCMDLRILYEDGSVETIITDKSWKTSHSPVIFNSIYTAEHYDANKEQSGWNLPGFDDSKWKNVSLTASPSDKIVSQQLHPIQDVEEIIPVKMNKLSETNYIYDLGRNISGVSEINVRGEKGTTLRIIHSERLNPEGKTDMSNIEYHYRPTDESDPFQTDIYILKGGEEETFRARFNYKGFQYVEIQSDQPISLKKENLKAWFMHSDVPVKGKIHSSDEMLNKIWWATNNSYLSNLFGYPTDCPQREKNGWTGDAHIAIETALYNFDGITVYEKWLADHQDEQLPNGVLPAIIPTDGWGYHWGNGVDWTSTVAIIPWNLYLFYGDLRPLEQMYDNIRRYVNYIDKHYPTGLCDWGLGDWIPIKSKANKELTSSIYFFIDVTILYKAARLLGKEEDNEKYTTLAEKIRNAINDKYLNFETGIYASGLQTELSAPLFWGIVPESKKELVARNLAEKVKADGQMDVGLLGSKAILNALSENGYVDIAWQLATRDTYPSWGWWIKNGATTLFENWNLEGYRDISLNHIMFREISAWYYKALGGIFPDEENPGFKNIILKPQFVESLTHFEARHESPYGEIVSSWKRKGKTVDYRVVIPPNSTAKLSVEASKMTIKQESHLTVQQKGKENVVELKAGTYQIQIKL